MKQLMSLLAAILPLILGSIFIVNFSFKQSPKKYTDLNKGIPMCRLGGDQFYFNITGDSTTPLAPLLDGLGDLHFAVSTKSKEAQKFFDQGYRLVYAFNHAEAHRSFQEAVRLDPNCAMAYWGQALALGPNINDPFPDMERQTEAYKAIQKAKSKKNFVSQMEQAMIDALATRCTEKEAEQQDLNVAYHRAMEKVYKQFPEHPEVGTLYADAIMNTMPWNYYDENMQPRPYTKETIDALEKVISKYPDHPGAHHLYIHIIEAENPDKAIPSADKLGLLMPKAGHIVHMPSHIYIGVGMYSKAAEVNRKAIEADEDYIAQCQAQGVYPLAYYPHNVHFLWAAASMLGKSGEAIQTGEKVANKVPASLAVDIPFIQDFLAVPLQAYVRFGKWNQILTTPPPNEDHLHTSMIWHYARGIAFVRRNQVERAEAELSALNKIVDNPATKELLAAYNNPTSEVGKVASKALAGEIAALKGDYKKAIDLLEQAVEKEMALVYQEPAAWHAPARQYLGAILLESGRPAEAEAVYRADLKKNRDNGWSLFGLYQSLLAQGKGKEAQTVKNRFEKAWQEADVALTASRF